MKKLFCLVAASLLLSGLTCYAERNYFVGTTNGWNRTSEIFVDGKYKDARLFLVIGTERTGRALNTLTHLRSHTTFVQDVRNGAEIFRHELPEAMYSIPENGSEFGKSLVNMVAEPMAALADPSIVTPAKFIWGFVSNAGAAGFNGLVTVGEPVVRTFYGTTALVAGPLIKPCSYTAVGTAIVATGVYGYGSSVAGGGVMSSATGVVLVMDIATAPAVGLYNHWNP